MGALETNTTLVYGIHLRESANDGSDFTNAATDYRIVFLGEDGQWHAKDSAGTVTDIGGDVSAHLADAADAHDASAISVLDTAANFTGTDVEAVLAELQDNIDGVTGGSSELDYAQVTSPVSITQTAEASADTIVSGAAVAYAAVPTMFEFFCPNVDPQDTALSFVTFYLYDGASSVGQMGYVRQQTNASMFVPVCLKVRLTPTAATHTYSVRATTNTGTATATAGTGGSGNYMPLYLRITTA